MQQKTMANRKLGGIKGDEKKDVRNKRGVKKKNETVET
jgi:hypothetical protein